MQEGHGTMASETDDAAAAAARLEAALERIAALAGPRVQPPAPPAEGAEAEPAVPVDEIAARLDSLIDRLRTALGTRQD